MHSSGLRVISGLAVMLLCGFGASPAHAERAMYFSFAETVYQLQHDGSLTVRADMLPNQSILALDRETIDRCLQNTSVDGNHDVTDLSVDGNHDRIDPRSVDGSHDIVDLSVDGNHDEVDACTVVGMLLMAPQIKNGSIPLDQGNVETQKLMRLILSNGK